MKSLLQQIAKKALSESLGDIPRPITLRSITVGQYDPILGSAQKTVTEYNLTAVIVGITEKDTKDVELLLKGKKALVAGIDLEGVSVDALDDLVIVDGETYKLESYKVDPAGALYSLMLTIRTPKANGV